MGALVMGGLVMGDGWAGGSVAVIYSNFSAAFRILGVCLLHIWRAYSEGTMSMISPIPPTPTQTSLDHRVCVCVWCGPGCVLICTNNTYTA